MGAPTLDLDSEEDADVIIDRDGLLRSLTQLARTSTATDAIQLLLSSIRFKQGEASDGQGTRKRAADETVEDRRAGDGKRRAREDKTIEDRTKACETEWKCKHCANVFSSKSYLERHVKNAHSGKWKRLVQLQMFECEECDYTSASEDAFKTHMENHASSNADTPKCVKYKCALCDKERAGIYNHYAALHKIEYPEQVLFENGNVLIRSAIDPKGGKALWFLNEKERSMKRYKDVTCRLCENETEFDNTAILADHYTLFHMVDPALLSIMKKLFRAQKGAHLLNLPASQTPYKHTKKVSSPAQKYTPSPVRNERGNIRWPCSECDGTYSNKANLKRHVENIHAMKPGERRDQVNAKPLVNKNTIDKPRDKTENSISSKSTKYKCTLCYKELVSIYKHYGGVHSIEYPEQIMFENGNVLVISNIDTDGGKAPWFLREKEKAKRYKQGTCRLCETEFENPGTLENHYRSDHMVIQSALNNLQCLFRAEKGTHLADMPTSRTPLKRKLSVSSTEPKGKPLAGSSGNKMDSKFNSHADSKVSKKPGREVEEQGPTDMITYQCEECGVATTTYDASVEHAQSHHLKGYKPITETCNICEFTFEAQCFADHSAYHSANEYKILSYYPSKLLKDEWFHIFQDWPEINANRIKSSSIYKHTRRIKMNSDVASGIPLYQCGMCDLYVHPKEVEDHCNNTNACVQNKSQNHFCSECDIFFFTSIALSGHEREHKNGNGTGSFRKVAFNCKQDGPINRALQKLQSNPTSRDDEVSRPSEESVQHKNRQSVEVIENVLVSQFCDLCNKFIMCSDLEAHTATHKYNSNEADEDGCNQRTEDVSQKDSGEESRNKSVETLESNEGTVEQWDTDNESCRSLEVSSYSVHVQVHVEKEEIEEVLNDNVDELAGRIDGDNSAAHVENSVENRGSQQNDEQGEIIEITDTFSEEMVNDLKRDIQNLFKQSDIDMKESPVSNKNLTTTGNLINVLESTIQSGNSANNETSPEQVRIINNEDTLMVDNENTDVNVSQDIFASNPNDDQSDNNANPEISMDIFTATHENDQNVANFANKMPSNVNTNANNPNNTTQITKDNIDNANTTVNLNTDNHDGIENSRQSSRDILSRMLLDSNSSDVTAIVEDENRDEAIEMDQQSLIEETQRIRELMFSRD